MGVLLWHVRKGVHQPCKFSLDPSDLLGLKPNTRVKPSFIESLQRLAQRSPKYFKLVYG